MSDPAWLVGVAGLVTAIGSFIYNLTTSRRDKRAAEEQAQLEAEKARQAATQLIHQDRDQWQEDLAAARLQLDRQQERALTREAQLQREIDALKRELDYKQQLIDHISDEVAGLRSEIVTAREENRAPVLPPRKPWPARVALKLKR